MSVIIVIVVLCYFNCVFNFCYNHKLLANSSGVAQSTHNHECLFLHYELYIAGIQE